MTGYAHEAARSAISTIVLYVVLAILGVLASLTPWTSVAFSLFQIGTLLKDIGDADDAHRLLQNFIAASINLLLGLALKDPFALLSIAPLSIVLAKALD